MRTPQNPAAWLMRCAQNRAIDLLGREAHLDRLAPRMILALGAAQTGAEMSRRLSPGLERSHLRVPLRRRGIAP
jgi:predicted RNA polymerase sigma factor